MAAGEGRRLRPLTAHWPKPVLPIDSRPVIATLLGELAEAGFPRAWVVIGHLAEQVERIAEEADPRPDVRFVRQPGVLGSADAVSRALAAGAEPPVLVTAADTVYQPGDLARFAGVGKAAIAWRSRPPAAALEIEDGAVLRVPAGRETPYFAAPLWLLTPEVAPFLDGLPGPPHELAVAFQRAIDAGTTVRGVEIGPTRDLTTPVDVVRHNFPYLETKSDE
jgi:UDP-N-acetylglucosamine diphosphorylase / glucose-1-phosphate thymidylyltransferase / UDP-N-acetylgalactosamine diphosphorylase / glucosamine-1-phosphate N-acetyltransferase / galactosamine-1-phosphate N-acetyltransferase